MPDCHAEFYRGLEVSTEVLHRVRDAGDAQRAAAVHAAMTATLGDTDVQDRLACSSGCSHCCHFPVGVTFGEARLLADALRGDPAATARLVDEAEATGTVSWHELVGRPCPLLQHGRCSHYAARPMPCRALASSDAEACERSLTGDAEAPRDEQAFWRGLGASSALAQAHPAGTRELRSAVAKLLATTDEGAAAAAFASARPAG